jgi:hypothetical protein
VASGPTRLDVNAEAISLEMLEKTPVLQHVDYAFRLAKARIPNAGLHEVELTRAPDGRSCNVRASFFDPTGARAYHVTLGGRNSTVISEFERTGGALETPFPTVPELRQGIQASLVAALKATFARFPRAKFNNLAIGAKPTGGLEYDFFQSWDWKNQPTVNIDATSGRRTAQIWDRRTEKQRTITF